MQMDREYRSNPLGRASLGTGKAVTLTRVMRSRGGKIEHAIRPPSLVAAAPHGDHHEQDKTNSTACPRNDPCTPDRGSRPFFGGRNGSCRRLPAVSRTQAIGGLTPSPARRQRRPSASAGKRDKVPPLIGGR